MLKPISALTRFSFLLLACFQFSVFGVVIRTEHADFMSEESSNGWIRTDNMICSPSFDQEIASVHLTCTNLKFGSSIMMKIEVGNQIRLVESNGTHLTEATVTWIDPRLPTPTDLWVTNLTSKGFSASWKTVEGAQGYRITLYTNLLVNSYSGDVLFAETFNSISERNQPTILSVENLRDCSDNDIFWKCERIYAAAKQFGVVQIGSSEHKGCLGIPFNDSLSSENQTLRFWASRFGNAGTTMPITILRNGCEMGIASVSLREEMQEFTFPLPRLEPGDYLCFNSSTNKSDGRVLLDGFEIVENINPGEILRVISFSTEVINSSFAQEGFPANRYLMTVQALGVSPEMDSLETEIVELPLDDPPLMPILNAVHMSDYSDTKEYVAPFELLPNEKVGVLWYNGVWPIPFWMIYREENVITKIGAGSSSSGTGTYTAFVFNSTNDVANIGPVLGTMASGSASMTYGIAFMNDTDRTVTSPSVAYSAVQWCFRNVESKTLSFEWLVTNSLCDVVAPGAWRNVEALDFSTPYPLPSLASRDYYWEEKSSLIPVERLLPGEYLILRFRDQRKSNSPGTGIARFNLSFNFKESPTLLMLR